MRAPEILAAKPALGSGPRNRVVGKMTEPSSYGWGKKHRPTSKIDPSLLVVFQEAITALQKPVKMVAIKTISWMAPMSPAKAALMRFAGVSSKANFFSFIVSVTSMIETGMRQAGAGKTDCELCNIS